jgi:hypothetical protein
MVASGAGLLEERDGAGQILWNASTTAIQHTEVRAAFWSATRAALLQQRYGPRRVPIDAAPVHVQAAQFHTSVADSAIAGTGQQRRAKSGVPQDVFALQEPGAECIACHGAPSLALCSKALGLFVAGVAGSKKQDGHQSHRADRALVRLSSAHGVG